MTTVEPRRTELDHQTPALQAIEVERVYRSGRGTLPVLRGVDLAVGSGDLVAIIGRSGSGKSTLLHQLGLLDVPDRGQVLVGGVDAGALGDTERSHLRGREIGFVFQAFHLLPGYDAVDNVAIAGTIVGMRRRAARKRAVTLLERVGLGDRLDHRSSELSGGEQQRVAIARGLMNDPRVLLADEPTGNLDPRGATAVLDLLVDLHATQTRTLVVVTHDPAVAERADRVVELRDGRIHEIGRASVG